jgi:hypothetical protein
MFLQCSYSCFSSVGPALKRVATTSYDESLTGNEVITLNEFFNCLLLITARLTLYYPRFMRLNFPMFLVLVLYELLELEQLHHLTI